MSTNWKDKDKRSYQERSDYFIKYVTKRRQVLKQKAVDLMGGRCMICKIERHPCVFDFHHVDPKTKSFGVSGGGITRSWEAVLKELKKCIMVCANCHREVSLGLHNQIEIEALHNTFWSSK